MPMSYKQRKALRQAAEINRTRAPARNAVAGCVIRSKISRAPLSCSEAERPSVIATQQQASANRRNAPITLPKISILEKPSA
jgi:hypothetical protein